MKLCEFAEELYEKLSKELDSISDLETPEVKCHEKSVSVLYDYLQRLKDFVKNYAFGSVEEEVAFFKEVKPKFTCLLIYHMAVYNIETEKPVGLEKMLQEYYHKELERLQYFFHENFDFHKYYRSGASHLDEKYFLRGNFDIHLSKGAFLLDLDASFSTLCDYKVARILANEMLVTYLNRAISNTDLKPGGTLTSTSASKFHLAWTASKTDFIELLYGLHCIGAFNNGSVELNKVMSTFGASFEVDFGNYSRYFQQMRIRKKNRTSFIDKIREKLVDYMDKLDDDLDGRL